jgi:hypothetical protein
MDFTMSVSPTVIYVPTAWSPEAEKARAKADFSHHWNDCETYVRINDVSYNFHTSTGDVPLCTTFRSSEIVQVGTVTAQLFPAQVLSLATCVSNFSEQYTDAVDHTFPAAAPPPSIDNLGRKTDSAAVDDLKFETKQEIKLPDVSKEFAVSAIRLNLLHTAGFSTDVDTPLLARSSAASRGAASTLSMTRVDVPRGLQLHSSSLITSESMQTTVVKLPSLELSHLRPLEAPQLRPYSQDNALDGLRWVCLAKVEVTGVTSISTEQRTDMESLFKLQQSFIYSHMVRDQADHDDQYSWHELNARRVRMDQPEAFEGDMGAYGPDAMRSAALYRKPSSKSLYTDVEGVRTRLPRTFSATSDGLAFISDGDEDEGVSKSESESSDTSDSDSDDDGDGTGANASDGALLGPELVRCLDSFKLEEFSHTLALKNKDLRTDARSKSPYLADVKMGGTSTGTTARHYPHTLFSSCIYPSVCIKYCAHTAAHTTGAFLPLPFATFQRSKRQNCANNVLSPPRQPYEEEIERAASESVPGHTGAGGSVRRADSSRALQGFTRSVLVKRNMSDFFNAGVAHEKRRKCTLSLKFDVHFTTTTSSSPQ